jgi:membrane protease YdiL (CAAX protease family)
MIPLLVGTLFQHLLFLFLLVVSPAWDYWDTRRLKRSPSSAAKIRYYRTLCSWLWIASAVALMLLGWRPLFYAPGDVTWLQIAWVRYLIEAVIGLLVLSIVLPVGIVLWKKLTRTPRKHGSADALKSLDYFLPRTWVERRWFTFVCVTAGICEETLFRGFLLYYMHVSAWGLNLTLALLISAVIFGLQHLYQGIAGTIQTGVIGLLFGLLFLLTGNLLAPTIVHAALDLRMLVILRPPTE